MAAYSYPHSRLPRMSGVFRWPATLMSTHAVAIPSFQSIHSTRRHSIFAVSSPCNLQNNFGGALRVDASDTGQALKQMADWSGSSLPEGVQHLSVLCERRCKCGRNVGAAAGKRNSSSEWSAAQ